MWRVVPSRKGVHSWVLEPKIAGQPPSGIHVSILRPSSFHMSDFGPLQVGVEVSTNTEDLVAHWHNEASTQVCTCSKLRRNHTKDLSRQS